MVKGNGRFRGGIPFHIFRYSVARAIDEVAVLSLIHVAYNEQFDLVREIEEGLDCVRI